MQAGDLFIQLFGQNVYTRGIGFALGPQFQLRQNLVGERRAHHERRVACGVAKVQQTAFRQQDDAVPVGHFDHIDLFFDVGPFVVAQGRHLDFVVKVADVANDGHVFHLADMFDADDVFVAGGGDEDIG